MEYFNKIKNVFIKSEEAISVSPTIKKPYSNRLKTQLTEHLQGSGTGTVYSRRLTHDISRTYDNLAQLYIKFDIVATPAEFDFSVKEGFAAKILSQIILRTKQGVILQTISPEYTLMRIDELSGSSSSFQRISVGLDPDDSFSTIAPPAIVTSGTCTVYLPLFMFFSEGVTNFLNTRMLEQLVLDVQIAPDNASMGIVELNEGDFPPPAITSITMTVYSTYHDVNTSSIIPSQPFSRKPGVPKSLVLSYNTFYEEDTLLVVGQSSARLLLRNNQALFNVHSFIRSNSDTTRVKINTITISVVGHEIVRELPLELNYTKYSEDRGYIDSEAYSYWFSECESRLYDSGLITFNSDDSMFPVFLTVTFDPLSASETFPEETWTLKVFSEYRTNHEVSSLGDIKNSYYPGSMHFPNSDLFSPF